MSHHPAPVPSVPEAESAACTDCAARAAKRTRRRRRLRVGSQLAAAACVALTAGSSLAMLAMGLPLYAGPLAVLSGAGISVMAALAPSRRNGG